MTSISISIIGLGTYARAIGTRGVEAGHARRGFNLALGVDILG